MDVANVLAAKGRDMFTTRPDVTVATAAKMLRHHRIGALIVCDEAGELVGLISEREIAFGLASHGAALLDMRVADLMLRSLPTCRPQDSLRTVMAQMTARRLRHFPVLEDGRLSGMISIGDVVKHRLDEVELEANVLRDAYVASH